MEDKKVEFVEDLWVQCDAPSCRKWRRLPAGSIVANHTRWYCRLNPDTRYNSCEIDEEFYDERNEILLSQPKTETERDSKNKSRKRKKDVKKESAERHAALKAELQRRRRWCDAKLKAITEDSAMGMNWATEDMACLQIHAPKEAMLMLQSMNMCSAMSYFVKEGDETRTELLESVKASQRSCVSEALNKASADIDQMLLEASSLS